MRMVLREERIYSHFIQALILIRNILPIVHKHHIWIPQSLHNRFCIRRKPSRHMREIARLPRVVGRLQGDDDLRALEEHQPSCIGHISRESLHHDARGGRASLPPGAGTVRAAAVGWVWAAAVVVAEFDEDEVAQGDRGGVGGEVTFDDIGEGGGKGWSGRLLRR
jgi:hypothetical protein